MPFACVSGAAVARFCSPRLHGRQMPGAGISEAMSHTVFGAPDPSVASDFSGPGILRQLSEAGFGPDLDPSGKLAFRGRVLRRTCGGGRISAGFKTLGTA